MAEKKLGFVTPPTRRDPNEMRIETPQDDSLKINTRVALWPERWPAIALQSCIDTVEAAPVEEQEEVKRMLPCQTCEKNSACLNAKRKELGPLLYSREILTDPRSADSSLFPLSLFQPMLNRSESLVTHWRPPTALENDYAVVQAWDIAFSEKTGGDYLVSMTGHINLKTGVRTLLEIERWQRKSFDEQLQLIEQKHQIFNSDLVVIETDAAQQIWSQQMKKTSVPVISHTSGEKQNLAHGVPGILILLDNKKWRIPFMAGSRKHEEVVNWLGEMEAFGWVDGQLQGIGEHDDTVMCFWHLNWGMQRFVGGGSFSEFRRGVVEGARA